MYKRRIPLKESHPLGKGIENLFEKAMLEKARAFKKAFIDIRGEQSVTKRGEDKTILETWKINDDEKTDLCNWLCENGTPDDFEHFQVIFNLLREITASESTNQSPQSG